MRVALLAFAFAIIAGCTTAEAPALQANGMRQECAPLNAKSAIVHCKQVPVEGGGATGQK